MSNIVSTEKTPFQNAVALSEFVYNNFNYQKGITNVESKTEEVWKLKAGVCQDFAHVMIESGECYMSLERRTMQDVYVYEQI